MFNDWRGLPLQSVKKFKIMIKNFNYNRVQFIKNSLNGLFEFEELRKETLKRYGWTIDMSYRHFKEFFKMVFDQKDIILTSKTLFCSEINQKEFLKKFPNEVGNFKYVYYFKGEWNEEKVNKIYQKWEDLFYKTFKNKHQKENYLLKYLYAGYRRGEFDIFDFFKNDINQRFNFYEKDRPYYKIYDYRTMYLWDHLADFLDY